MLVHHTPRAHADSARLPANRRQSLFGDAALGDEFVDEAPEFHHTMLEAAPPETKDNDAEEEEAAEFKGGEGDEGPGEGEEEEEGAAAQAKAVVPKSLQDRVLPLNVNTLNVDVSAAGQLSPHPLRCHTRARPSLTVCAPV